MHQNGLEASPKSHCPETRTSAPGERKLRRRTIHLNHKWEEHVYPLNKKNSTEYHTAMNKSEDLTHITKTRGDLTSTTQKRPHSVGGGGTMMGNVHQG